MGVLDNITLGRLNRRIASLNHMLVNKTIVIISPQSWGTMFLAKHHYAVTLAKRGNRVFFLNPPDQTKLTFPGNVECKSSGADPNLQLINHTLFFPYWLRFKITWLFHALMRLHVKDILKKTGPVDIVWSFDQNNNHPLRFWGKNVLKIFHPIDEPHSRHAMEASRDADILFSVTNEILDKYNYHSAPKHFIHHGVEDVFFEKAQADRPINEQICCGLAGNLIRADLDRPTLLQIIHENPAVRFECWGSFTVKDSNVGGGDNAGLQQFIAALQALPNVVLYGPVAPHVLARELHRMDVLLVCYDIEKDQSRGTNSHKLMEYLSTGKVIVSNNITTYDNRPDLITMTAERDNNRNLPALFREVVNQIETYDAPDRQFVRIEFARENTYNKQIERISHILDHFTSPLQVRAQPSISES